MSGQGEDDVASGGHGMPLDTDFRQQRMAAIQPIVTPAWVVGLFMTFGVLFVPLGAWLRLKNGNVVELERRYEGAGKTVDCSISASNEGRKVTFTVDEDMTGPIYVYYELGKFYQNHRSYVKSRSFDQLAGGAPSADSCSPLESTDAADPLHLSPCGLVANSFFNDVIVVSDAPDPYDPLSPFTYMDESGISWVSDRDGDFAQPDGFVGEQCALSDTCDNCLGSSLYSDCGSYTDERTGVTYKYWYPDDSSTQYLYENYPDAISPVQGVEDEHFVVWMRTAALSTFRNLYGRIEHDLEAADSITFNVTANFHVADFGGTKSLILTTLSSVGTRNGVLGGAFMAVGGACLAAGLVVLSKFQSHPREVADTEFLKLHGGQ